MKPYSGMQWEQKFKDKYPDACKEMDPYLPIMDVGCTNQEIEMVQEQLLAELQTQIDQAKTQNSQH
jgi:hypothetical protein